MSKDNLTCLDLVIHSELNTPLNVGTRWMVDICWHTSKARPPEETMRTAGTPPLPLQSWELSPSAVSSPWQPTLAQSLSTNLYHIFLAYSENSYPYFPHILFRRQALQRPRLEWGTETMNTISCSKVKKKKKEKKEKKKKRKKKKDDCIPLYTGSHRLSRALWMLYVLLCLCCEQLCAFFFKGNGVFSGKLPGW